MKPQDYSIPIQPRLRSVRSGPHHSISQSRFDRLQNRKAREVPAHLGVLLLDEFPEFNQGALQGLREPLDHKQVQISRVEP